MFFLILNTDYSFLFGSLHSFGVPSCWNCEHVSPVAPFQQQQQQQQFGPGGQTPNPTTTTTITNGATSSLGLLQLLQERGISASTRPHHNLHCTHQTSTKPSRSTANERGGGSRVDKEERKNIFSLNLVGKLQRLGLQKVAAWGMMGHDSADRQPPKV